MMANDPAIQNIISIYDNEDDAKYYRRPSSREVKSFWERIHLYLRNDEFNKVFDNLKPYKGGTALDVGCSGGRYLYRLAQIFDRVVGIDTSRVALEYVRNNPEPTRGSIELLQCSVTDLHFRENSFDLVLIMELLHHISDRYLESIIANISSMLKPEGTFIFDIKNKNNWFIRRAYRRGSQIEYPRIAREAGYFTGLLENHGFRISRKIAIGNLKVIPAVFSPGIIIFAELKA